MFSLNYPLGVTTADLPGWQRDTSPDITKECGACRREFDPEEEMHVVLNQEPLCEECRELCAGNCGEYLTDETVASYGPVVHYRDSVYAGKLVAAHASCAAETIMGYMMRDFDYDHTTREEITAIVEANSAQAVPA